MSYRDVSQCFSSLDVYQIKDQTGKMSYAFSPFSSSNSTSLILTACLAGLIG